MSNSPRDYNKLQAEYDKLLEFATYWHQKALQHGANGPIAAQGVQPVNLPKPLIDRLIRFCHPDRHDNDPIATALTQELLKMREKS